MKAIGKALEKSAAENQARATDGRKRILRA
jgi:hypothetical protein